MTSDHFLRLAKKEDICLLDCYAFGSMNPIYLTVLVAALGYFVDIYDLLLFSIVRVPSLKDIGIPESELLEKGVLLINMQMMGLLIGGILWGILGDKKGRLSVLFGSIFLYSLANFANAFVHDIHTYSILRLIAGIGLAGELGAGITLVSELLPKDQRGLGTSLVASIGILGAVVGGLVADLTTWRNSYMIGGVMGLLLLALRMGVAESRLFQQLEERKAHRGHFLSLFKRRATFLKYLRCILLGVPIWYAIGILITFSPEFGKYMNTSFAVKAGHAVLWSYLGSSFGDLSCGLLSQYLKSRRQAVFIFSLLSVVFTTLYLTQQSPSELQFYGLCALVGYATGYWAVFVTIGAEQFGTNLRATTATTVPNFVRGSVIPLTTFFQWLNGRLPITQSAAIVGAACISISLLSLWKMEETFHHDLNFIEPHL